MKRISPLDIQKYCTKPNKNSESVRRDYYLAVVLIMTHSVTAIAATEKQNSCDWPGSGRDDDGEGVRKNPTSIFSGYGCSGPVVHTN